LLTAAALAAGLLRLWRRIKSSRPYDVRRNLCRAPEQGDRNRVATYISTMQSKYVNSGFPWPFYNAEAGWFMRANNYMLGRGW